MKLLFTSIIMLLMFCPTKQSNNLVNGDLEGAWEGQLQDEQGSEITSMILIKDGFLVETHYNLELKKFSYTLGGSYQVIDNLLTLDVDFSTMEEYPVGDNISLSVEVKDNQLFFDGVNKPWKRVDSGSKSEMGHAWFFAGRYRDGELSRRNLGPRKTMKMLTDKRFQWIAYNDETGEFFGTGGGTYTAAEGKYTENIEFFSRDSSRVGASLSFDFELIDGEWHHSGLSSKGDPIHEIWAPYEKLKAMSESKE